MARWTVSWLLLIGVATAGAYWGTNAVVGQVSEEDSYAMQVLGGSLGSPECSQATRLLVAASDRTHATALPDERRNVVHAARAVLDSCGPP